MPYVLIIPRQEQPCDCAWGSLSVFWEDVQLGNEITQSKVKTNCCLPSRHQSKAVPPKRLTKQDFKSISIESGFLFPARLDLFTTQPQTCVKFSSLLHCGTPLCGGIQTLAKWTLLVLVAVFYYKLMFSERSLCFSTHALYASLFPFLQPELGKPKRNCYPLPGFDFTYGMYMHRRDGGVPEGRTLPLKHRPAANS